MTGDPNHLSPQSIRAGSTLCLLLAALAIPTNSLPAQAVRIGNPGPRPQLVTSVLTLSASPASLNVSLAPHTTSAPASVSLALSWLLTAASTISVYGSFASQQALQGARSGMTIPSSAVRGQDAAGVPVALRPFTQTTPISASSSGILILRQSALASVLSSRTDTLSLVIDLSTLSQLPADTYSGVLTLQAQAF